MDNNIDFQLPGNFPFRDNIRVTDAVIQSVTTDRGTAFVTIEYNDCATCRNRMQVTLIVNRDTVIRDERGRNIPARDLEAGMLIDATFSQAMTRSIPPQAQAFQIRVKRRRSTFSTTIGRILEVNTREQFLRTISDANPASIVRFNISPETRRVTPPALYAMHVVHRFSRKKGTPVCRCFSRISGNTTFPFPFYSYPCGTLLLFLILCPNSPRQPYILFPEHRILSLLFLGFVIF